MHQSFFGSLHCLLGHRSTFFLFAFGEPAFHERLSLNVLHQKVSCVDGASLSTPSLADRCPLHCPPPQLSRVFFILMSLALGGLSFSLLSYTWSSTNWPTLLAVPCLVSPPTLSVRVDILKN